ncbi:hypothetical protein TRIATDRAFT_283843 [Trichoderma atroviride IMI 206040]|uniref:Sialidase n=1 Tax=Hypocrea atroviridis (strain ATCC 20476 / IMI 206040) TaxID=452589 RepID=G9NUX3_HYPAI|nr:uncharacterized protein TRIATDRAFT_283843 [Trichoderma atroviride IMI 206040]EHK44797.1 hypothetical protein TRIATDRAFT_283843 [Trichoderma atroviride IMI 206040]
MSALAADVSFDFTFPSPSSSLDAPPTPPMESLPVMEYSLDHFPSSLLELPYNSHNRHARSTSRASSVYSAISAVDSIAESACSRFTTPPRASPPVRQHGPLLLPKIRSQDQQLDQSHVARAAHSRSNSIRSAASARARMVHQQSTPPPASSSKPIRTSHSRSYTNPETLANMAFAHISPFNTPPPQTHDEAPVFPSSLLASPQTFAQDLPQPRRTSTIDTATIDKYGYPTYRQMPFVPSTTAAAAAASQSDYIFSSYLPRAPSPLALAATATPDAEPSTTLMQHLTCVNPAASLVRTISFPLRDPSIKHFWWDVRSVSSWSTFNASTVLSLPGASALLNSPVPASLLQTPSFSSRHPETETALHSIYASFYLPKLNSALAMSSNRPLQLSVPAKTASGVNDLIFVANPMGESSTAAAIFGGKPTGRVVGLVRSFDRFNTGMRAEGNIKRVDYLRGLAALHYAMREHGCRYGFILTEIELVLVRAGTESTPFFGDLEITSVQLNAAVSEAELDSSDNVPLTACLALWGLCQLAGDQTPAGHAHWKAEIGAPADGTRRKAKARDNWIPKPQLAEKREAKRSRGWVWPEDPIGRKEMGKRGVKYGGLC